MGFKIGDVVKVKDMGRKYTTYADWFEEQDISPSVAARYKYGSNDRLDLNQTYKVIAIGKHGASNDVLVLIEVINKWGTDGAVYLFGEEGLKFNAKTVTLDELLELAEEKYGCEVELEM